MGHLKWTRLGAIALITILASLFPLSLPLDLSTSPTNLGTEAWARRRSGGRSGGGSFNRRSTSPSRNTSPSRSTSPSRNTSPSRQVVPVPVPVAPAGSTRRDRDYRTNPGTTTTTTTPNSNTSSSGNPLLGFLILLAFGGLMLGPILFFVIRAMMTGGQSKEERELDNDTVTITQLQVALLAQARQVQADLNQISLEIDTDTPAGVQQLLQESALALLRTPENWSHARVSTEVLRGFETAESAFNKISLAERSKYSVETLTNVGGRVRHTGNYTPEDEGPGSYIVVTFLVGTAHDRPIIDGDIHSPEDLENALQTLAAMSPDYLLKFEIIWTPQHESDTLTYDELLTDYSNLMQI